MPARDPEPGPTDGVEASVSVARLAVGDRQVVVSVAEPDDEAAPATMEVAVLRGGSELARFSSTGGHAGCAEVKVDLEPVQGGPSPLVVAQVFCENGEDEFSRGVGLAVVHVGSDAAQPRLLWEGHGAYQNSFGRCEVLDVPAVRTEASQLVVERIVGTVAQPNPQRLGGPCAARAVVTKRVARIAY